MTHYMPNVQSQSGGPTGPRRCVVHIGMPKTGSSAIQTWLSSNVAQLGQQGILFDPVDITGHAKLGHVLGFATLAAHVTGGRVPNAHMLRYLKIETPQEQTQLCDLLEQHFDAALAQSDCHTCVISSEYLQPWLGNQDAIQAWDTWLQKRFSQVQYVVYLRDQVTWAPSAYGQNLRKGAVLSLDEFVSARGRYNYFAVCKRWSDATEGRLNVRLLEAGALEGDDLIADFAHILGAEASVTKRPERVNEALGTWALGLLRRYNRMTSGQSGNVVFRTLRNLFAKSALATKGRTLTLTKAQSLHVANANAAHNEKLRQQFFPKRDVLFARSHQVLKNAGLAAGALPGGDTKEHAAIAAAT